VPILAIIVSGALMASLPRDTWLRLVVWLVVGLVVYFTYGKRHSRVQAAHTDAALAARERV
jgi:APA family basic amino acid/polyamine antiporter